MMQTLGNAAVQLFFSQPILVTAYTPGYFVVTTVGIPASTVTQLDAHSLEFANPLWPADLNGMTGLLLSGPGSPAERLIEAT